jgi:hypothetical protein
LQPPRNYTELLDREWKIARNPSYWDSLRLGFMHGIWWAPTSFFRSMKCAFITFIIATGMLVLSVGAWFVLRVLLLFAALCGYITPLPPERVDAGGE